MLDRTIAPSGGGRSGLVGGRYELRGLLGQGGGGSVHRAFDQATGRIVALKFFSCRGSEGETRARREILALRILRIPGVVTLLDDGLHDGEPYYVMELVAGRPFPGRSGPLSWTELAPLARQLLLTLHEIHTQGIVHRDLKPANVLVEGELVTLVDFGVARGESLGATITAEGALIGTPLWMPPELLAGERLDLRADLYGVGLILFQALSGRLPHRATTLPGLLAERLESSAFPLLLATEGVPPEVATVVDRLLSRDPADRPPSAAAALAALGEGPPGPPLRWLGARTVLDMVLTAVERGDSIDIGGAPGSGRSRLLGEVADALTAGGRAPLRLRPGEGPLESLAGVLSLPPDGVDPPGMALRLLEDRLAAGTAILSDDVSKLDWLTRKLLERVRPLGAVVRVVEGPGDVTPAPLRPADLQALFHGPEALFHLRTDAADLLWRITDGVPAAVVEEVAAWTSRGLAEWRDGRLQLGPRGLDGIEQTPRPRGRSARHSPDLERFLDWIVLAGSAAERGVLERATRMDSWVIGAALEELVSRGAVRVEPGGRIRVLQAARLPGAWDSDTRIAAHAALAAALPPGAAGRLLHLSRAGDLTGLGAEAVATARRLYQSGNPGAAIPVLELAISVGGTAADRELTTELARCALADGTLARVRMALAALTRAPATHPSLVALLEAWALLESGRGAAAAERLNGLEPFPDPEIDAVRELVPLRVLAEQDPDAATAALLAWPDAPDPSLARRRREWLGQLRFLGGWHGEAATLHAGVAEVEPLVHRRAIAWINSAYALREAGRLDEARTAFDRAREVAAAQRLPHLEGYAVVGIRGIEYRTGALVTPDLDLCEALLRLELPLLIAAGHLTEAALAWRAGDTALGRRLALRAAGGWARPSLRAPRALALALATACGAEAPTGLLEESAEAGPLMVIQVAALLHYAGVRGAAEAGRAAASQLGASIPVTRLGVLSCAEALDMFQSVRGGGVP